MTGAPQRWPTPSPTWWSRLMATTRTNATALPGDAPGPPARMVDFKGRWPTSCRRRRRRRRWRRGAAHKLRGVVVDRRLAQCARFDRIGHSDGRLSKKQTGRLVVQLAARVEINGALSDERLRCRLGNASRMKPRDIRVAISPPPSALRHPLGLLGQAPHVAATAGAPSRRLEMKIDAHDADGKHSMRARARMSTRQASPRGVGQKSRAADVHA